MRESLHVVSFKAEGALSEPGLSGCDRIAIECTKRWKNAFDRVYVYVGTGGLKLYRDYGLKNIVYEILPTPRLGRSLPSMVLLEMYAFLGGIVKVLAQRNIPAADSHVIYSSSDFWPDAIPAWLLKKRLKNSRWIATFYLFAPKPTREGVYKGRRLIRGILYFLSQKPIYWLIKRSAQMVFVTNEDDRWKFIDGERSAEKVLAVEGGVDTKTPSLIPDPERKDFDAVFLGRLHPQKGILELIDIWRGVCARRPDARLAIVGVGDLLQEVRKRIEALGLNGNVSLLGFLDGEEKIKIFKRSKIVVHPAIYDSGGMAACEAMACGLPAVGFDLPALRTYYPKGMIKATCYDHEEFAAIILRLLEDDEFYARISAEALDLAKRWEWDDRALTLLEAIRKMT
jgi:glycosyltransferase involved in cell wall biosynthesis